MVCEWGMSDALGPLTFGKKEEQIFLGREIAQHRDYSEDTAMRIDQEVKRIVTDDVQAGATRCCMANNASLDAIAEALLFREVLDADQVRRIVAGLPLETVPANPAGAPVPPLRKTIRPRGRKQRPSIVPPLNKPLPQE